VQEKNKAAIEADNDLYGSEESEDKEILKSIEYAEKKLGTQLSTPHKVKGDNPWSPVKYDIENVGTHIDAGSLNNVVNTAIKQDNEAVAQKNATMQANATGNKTANSSGNASTNGTAGNKSAA